MIDVDREQRREEFRTRDGHGREVSFPGWTGQSGVIWAAQGSNRPRKPVDGPRRRGTRSRGRTPVGARGHRCTVVGRVRLRRRAATTAVRSLQCRPHRQRPPLSCNFAHSCVRWSPRCPGGLAGGRLPCCARCAGRLAPAAGAQPAAPVRGRAVCRAPRATAVRATGARWQP